MLCIIYLPGFSSSVLAEDAPQQELSVNLQELITASLKAKQEILLKLEKSGGQAMIPAFEAMLEGDLYYRKADSIVVIASKGSNGNYSLVKALSGEALSDVAKKEIKKIRVNNALRIKLRTAIARLTLASDDPALRKKAVKNISNKLTDDSIELLKQAKSTETVQSIVTAIDSALALYALDSEDADARLQAINDISGDLSPAVRNKLNLIVEVDDEGEYAEADAGVRAAAVKALQRIESKIKVYKFLEQLFFGISLGSVLLLAATGLAITFGVMGVINMAHGEMIMLGAYTTYVIQQLLPNFVEYSIFLAIPAAFIVAGLVGVLIERGVIQFLHGRPLETLLATFGISLILQQTVRTIFSPLNRQVITPEWLSGSLEVNAVLSLTYNRLYIILFALLVFAFLQLILKKTSLGLHVRAVSQNRNMAKAIGIRSGRVDALTFGLGSGIAGVAGVALSQLTNVGPNLGQAYIIDSFMVTVFGGVGNLWGTFVGGFTLGIANKFLEPVTGAVLANILVLVFIILFIQKRPRGLFPQKGRAAES